MMPTAAAAVVATATGANPMNQPDAGFQVISLSRFVPTTRSYKSRKDHKKTKLGCLACKAKRVKVRGHPSPKPIPSFNQGAAWLTNVSKTVR